MNDAAAHLNTAAGDIITNSRTTTQQLSQSSENYNRAYQHFVDAGLTLAGRSELHIRRGKRDNLGIIFHMNPLKHML